MQGELLSQYKLAEDEILRLLARGDITDWRRAFATQQLAQVRALLDNLSTNAASWARYHLPTLYEAGLAVVDGHLMQLELAPVYRGLREQGLGHMDAVRRMAAPGGLSIAAHPGEITPMDLGFTRLHTEAVDVLVENTVMRLGTANRYAAQWVEIMAERARGLRNDPRNTRLAWIAELKIRDASLSTLQQAFAQAKTQQEARKVFLESLRKRGISSFTDRAGRAWSMTDYAEMVVQTVSQEAMRHAAVLRMQEAGQDVMRVSDHAEECKLCRPWERRLLSVTGATPGLPTVNQAIAAGLMHPRCSHVLLPEITAASIAAV